MQLFHFYHQSRWQQIIHSDFWRYEASVWLHTFSRALIAVFIPIFIYQIGYSIQEIILYYLIYTAINFPLNFLARWFIKKIGARWVTVIGSGFSLAFFAALYALGPDNWPLLLLIALFAALYDTFYWVAHIYFFMKCSKNDKDITKDQSFQLIIKKVAGVLAPALGAAILIFFHRQALIIVSMVFLFLSVLPLFKLKQIEDKPTKKLKSLAKFFAKKDTLKDYLMAGFYAIHWAAEEIIWPLFIFISLSSIESVAILPILISFTAIIFLYLTGNIAKKRRSMLIVLGSVLIALIWLLRMFIDASWFYYLSVVLIALFSVFISVPLYSAMYEKGESLDALSTSTYRNATHVFARLLFFAALYFLMDIFNVSFAISAVSMLVVAIITYALGGLVKEKKRFGFIG